MKGLSGIYTAKQCTDLNDVDTAIDAVKKLANGEYTPALRKRLNSLEKRKKQLTINVTGLRSLCL